jgi:hypothetical protein
MGKRAAMTTKDTPSASGTALSKTAPIDDNTRVGLALLSQAFACARDAGADLWDFALEINTLYETGLTISDLRWLVAKKFAEHGQETSVYGSPHRSFRRGDGFFFDRTTCVVLTPRGAAFVDHVLRAPVVSPRSISPIETTMMACESSFFENGPSAGNERKETIAFAFKPRWSSTQRELSLDGLLVKRFRVPAQNQEMILGAFQEEGWPKHVDDPLPVRRDIDPRTRLHDVINRLNGCQRNPLLRFHGNGTGTGVFWELRQTVVLR